MVNLYEKKVLTKEEYTKIIRNIGGICMLQSVIKGLDLGIYMGAIKKPQDCLSIIDGTLNIRLKDLENQLREYGVPIGNNFTLEELMEKVIVVEEDK